MMRSSILGASTMLNVLIQHLPLQSLSWTNIWKAFRASDPSKKSITVVPLLFSLSLARKEVSCACKKNLSSLSSLLNIHHFSLAYSLSPPPLSLAYVHGRKHFSFTQENSLSTAVLPSLQCSSPSLRAFLSLSLSITTPLSSLSLVSLVCTSLTRHTFLYPNFLSSLSHLLPQKPLCHSEIVTASLLKIIKL